MLKRYALLWLAVIALPALADEPAKAPPAEPVKRLDLAAFAIKDNMPIPLWEEGNTEVKAYQMLLGKAWRTSAKTFAAAARKDIPYPELVREPGKHRGEVVHVEGLMTQLRQRPAPRALDMEGLPTIYMGWVHDPAFEGHNPVTVLFTSLPKGLNVAEDFRQYVAFDGYYYKVFRYETKDGWADAPLLIGQTPKLLKAPPVGMDESQRALSAVATVVATSDPADRLGLLHVATIANAWPRETAAEPPITKATRLDLTPFIIEDNRPIPDADKNNDPQGEPSAYRYVLSVVHKMMVEVLKAGVNPMVNYAHMLKEAESVRGEIVQVKGTLTRLRRYDPPLLSRRDGIKDLYEGWVFDPKIYGANPTCIVFTELPPGLEVAELTHKPITFYGFFFKTYAYESGEKNAKGKAVWRAAPLVMGKTVMLDEAPAAQVEDNMSLGTGLVMIFLALLAGTMFFALGLVVWYRRGDRHIRSRIAGASSKPFVDPSELPPQPPSEEFVVPPFGDESEKTV